MRPPIDDGVVLLTGASSGIGAAIARELAPRARAIVLVARRADRLEALAAELRPGARGVVEVRPCDLTDAAALAALVDGIEADIGPVDVLVNNAGLGDFGLLERAQWDKLRWMLDVNVTALTYRTWRVLPGMVARGRGGILQISSGFGLTFMPLFSAYVGTKHYVTALTDSLRAELSGTGVVVTQVCPGPVATEFEQVAAGGQDLAVPGAMQISAARCAREAVRAFSRGRALVVPGWLAWVGISLGRLTPRWVLRLIYAPVGRVMRRR